MARRATEEQKAKMRRLRGLGWTYKAIGDVVGCSDETVSVWCNPSRLDKARDRDKSRSQEESRVPYMKDYLKEYCQRQEYKDQQKAYHKTPSAKEKKLKHSRLPNSIARRKEHQRTPEAQEILRVRLESPEGRAYRQNFDNRRRAQMETGNGITTIEYLAMWEAQNGRCYGCGDKMILPSILGGDSELSRDLKYCTIDHVVPVSRGGKHELSNMGLLCRSCNSSKYSKTPAEWRELQLATA